VELGSARHRKSPRAKKTVIKTVTKAIATSGQRTRRDGATVNIRGAGVIAAAAI
jgi:hypothetical protein